MKDLARLLFVLFVWLPTRPMVSLGNELLVRVGLKRRVATGAPVWRRR